MLIRLGLISLVAFAAFGQETIFRSETRPRQIEVRVHEKEGGIVAGLTADDFAVRVNGRNVGLASLDFVERSSTPRDREPSSDVPSR